MIAASVAFSGVLSIFPVLIAIVSIYGLVFDPVDVISQIQKLSITLPASARTLLRAQLREIVGSSVSSLGVSLVASIVTTLTAGSGGMHSLIQGINLAYGRAETRSYVRVRLLALTLTLAVVAFTVVVVATITIVPHVLELLGLGPASRALVSIGRWPALAVGVMIGLSMLYRFAPDRARPPWHLLSFGSVFATGVWLIASLAFGAYAANFGNYNKTYGALAGMVVFMLWVYVSTLAILLGAELDAELERMRGQA